MLENVGEGHSNGDRYAIAECLRTGYVLRPVQSIGGGRDVGKGSDRTGRFACSDGATTAQGDLGQRPARPRFSRRACFEMFG